MTSSRFSASARRVAAAALVTLAVAGCGIRVGSPPAPIPSPDQAEEQRQQAAIALERVRDAAGREGSAADPRIEDLIDVTGTYLEDLGGVWLPPPRDEDPSPVSPAVTGEPADLASVLAESAADVLGLVSVDENPEALASIWLTLRSARAAVSGEDTGDCAIPCGSRVIPAAFARALATGETDGLDALLQAIPTRAPELIGIYDALAYLEEIRAARSSGEARDEVARGAKELRRFADLLAGEAAGSEADTRLSAYEVDLEDLGASARGYLSAAATQWLVLLAHAPAEDAEASAEALWHTYAAINPALEVEPWPGLGGQGPAS